MRCVIGGRCCPSQDSAQHMRSFPSGCHWLHLPPLLPIWPSSRHTGILEMSLKGHCFSQYHGVYSCYFCFKWHSSSSLPAELLLIFFRFSSNANSLLKPSFISPSFSFFHPSVNLSFYQLQSILFLPVLWHLLFNVYSILAIYRHFDFYSYWFTNSLGQKSCISSPLTLTIGNCILFKMLFD